MDQCKNKKVVCPKCNGNGYIKIPHKLIKKERITQCSVCNSEGEMDENKVNSIYIDSSGVHRVH